MLQDRGRQKGKEDKLCSMFTADLRGSWVGAVIRQNTGDSMTPLLLFLLLVSTGNSLAVLAGEDLCGHRQVDVEDPKLSPAAAALPGGLSFFQVLAPSTSCISPLDNSNLLLPLRWDLASLNSLASWYGRRPHRQRPTAASDGSRLVLKPHRG